jgi:hypothetical protein
MLNNDDVNKIVLKVYDKSVSGEKRAHNCNLCQIYKREIAKGDKDALVFYRDHINEFVKRYNGATLVFNVKPKMRVLPVSSSAGSSRKI